MDYRQIPGWFDFANLYDVMVARARPGALFVEVGAYLGRSTAYLGSRIQRSGKDVRVYVVDLWDGWFYDDFRPQTPMAESDGVYWHFLDNMRKCQIDHLLCPVKLPSEQAATLFADGSIDFVFLDGDHGYEAVLRDLCAWYPKVRPGGHLAGHDYDNPQFPGVRRAVDEFFHDNGLPYHPNRTSFVAPKPGGTWLGKAAGRCRQLCAALKG
jgi:SAM-dependent methyltransferase